MGLSKEQKDAKRQVLTKFSIKISLASFENASCVPHCSGHSCWKGAQWYPHSMGIRDTGKIVIFLKTGGRTGLRERKCMKLCRLGRKPGRKWRPNSLDPSLLFFLPLCLLFLLGFPWHILVKTRDEHLLRAWAELRPCNQLVLVLWARDTSEQTQVTWWCPALVWSLSGLP